MRAPKASAMPRIASVCSDSGTGHIGTLICAAMAIRSEPASTRLAFLRMVSVPKAACVKVMSDPL